MNKSHGTCFEIHPRFGRDPFLARGLLLIPILLWFLLRASLTFASEPVTPIVPEGYEDRILALFQPIEFEGKIIENWVFDGLKIRSEHLEATLAGPKNERLTLTLAHPSTVKGNPDLNNACFAIETDMARASPGGKQAIRRMAEVLKSHERDCPWELPEREIDLAGMWSFWSTLIFDFVYTAGILHYFVACLVIFVLAFRRDDSIRTFSHARLWLLGAFVLGVVLRLTLVDPTPLGVNIYQEPGIFSRLFDSLFFRQLSGEFSKPVYLHEWVFSATLAYAFLLPPAIFALARILFGDDRPALAAALLVAVNPNHLRFSASEVFFIPSITLAATCMALTAATLLSTSRIRRAVGLILLAYLSSFLVQMRYLDILHALPMAGLFLLPFARNVPHPWKIIVAGVALASTLGFGTWYLLNHSLAKIQGSVHSDLFANIFQGWTNLNYNTLLHPRITPPPLLLAAILGGGYLFRNHRMLLLLLAGWIALFLSGHSIVLPDRVEMQARYHLHLVLPLCLLAAAAISMNFWKNKRVLAVAGLALLASAPLTHFGYIRDDDFNSIHEYRFLASLVEKLPEKAAVVEWRGSLPQDSRFNFFGQRVQGGKNENKFEVSLYTYDNADDIKSYRFEESHDQTTYYYEGLSCYYHKLPYRRIAPFCAAMHRCFSLDPVSSTTFDNRFYDENRRTNYNDDATQSLTLTLYRILGPSKSPESEECFLPPSK